MKKFGILSAIILSLFISFIFFLKPKEVFAQVCSGYPTCSRYQVCEDHTLSQGYTCSSNPCGGFYSQKCIYPDFVASDYLFSCCGWATPQPTETPAPPPPSGWLCSGQGIENTNLACESVCNQANQNCAAVTGSCGASCQSLGLTGYIYKCFNQVDNNSANIGGNRYLFSCCPNQCNGAPGGGPPPPVPIPPPPIANNPPPTDAIPLPPVPCNEVRPPDGSQNPKEFHSLRPYQASPCDPLAHNLALFCGNDILIPDSFSVIKNFNPDRYTYNGGPITPNPSPCVLSPDGTHEVCTFTIHRESQIVIDVNDAYLPIMGFTEPSVGHTTQPNRVINSVAPAANSETVPRTTKVNEYVSWYLNGTLYRPEYAALDMDKNCLGTDSRPGICEPVIPFPPGSFIPTCMLSLIPPIPHLNPLPLHPDGRSTCTGPLDYCCVSSFAQPVTMLDRDKVINFSGPLNKLLSNRSQRNVRS